MQVLWIKIFLICMSQWGEIISEIVFLKFIYSEKVWWNLPFEIQFYIVNVTSIGRFCHIFVAFSWCMNFNIGSQNKLNWLTLKERFNYKSCEKTRMHLQKSNQPVANVSLAQCSRSYIISFSMFSIMTWVSFQSYFYFALI